MIQAESDNARHLLTLCFSQFVSVEEMEFCVERVRRLLDSMDPGFLLLTDLTGLEEMDPLCAHPIGAILELCADKSIRMVVRVIPDPTKDIGLDIIAHFHQRRAVRSVTYETLAEARSGGDV
jgi:hypothetical protein